MPEAAGVQRPQRPADRAEHRRRVARPEAEAAPAGRAGRRRSGRTAPGWRPRPGRRPPARWRSASGPAAPAAAGGGPRPHRRRPEAAAATPGRRPGGTRCPARSSGRRAPGPGARPAGTAEMTLGGGRLRRSGVAHVGRPPRGSRAGPFVRTIRRTARDVTPCGRVVTCRSTASVQSPVLSTTPAASKVATSCSARAAPATTGSASSAPVPSPRRIPRSSSGVIPRAARARA